MSSITKQPCFLKFTTYAELVKLDQGLNFTNIGAGYNFQKASPLKNIKMSSFTKQPSILKFTPCAELVKLDQLVNFTNISLGCKFQKASHFFSKIIKMSSFTKQPRF